AGLSTIPKQLYEQAMIDGTNILQRFSKITLPLLKPVIVVALLFRTIDAVRIFDLIYVLTGGGPGGSTTSISLYAFKYYLNGDFGYGSAISVIVFLVASGLAILYLKVGKFTEMIK
ncbi:MAG TPA: sugar ABC transporter permease, partial [Ignavibacteria bacterium]|nr:sugar ABC transporter permease [Ignavibacteria bacterium]